MFDFSDRVVLIAGGTGSLGKAVAEAFFQSGARLVLVDRSPDKQREIFPDWVDDERVWLAAPVDVTKLEEAQQTVAQTVERFGRLDVLVNAVGAYRAGKPTHETDVATWEFMLDVNARSAFIMSHAAAPAMLEQGGGKIVNVGARPGLEGPANHSAYSASKAMVMRLTESMAAELKAKGVNVNCVLPALIDTPDNREAMPKADWSKWVEPASLAGVIQFLASDLAKDIHGASLPVYGLT